MNPDRWNKLEALIEQALELPTEQRAGFVNNACGTDTELRADIVSLLGYSETAETFIEEITENVVWASMAELLEARGGQAAREVEQQMPGQTVGHYHISETLGRGGMGVVYKARDTKLGRTVALKFLPPCATHSEEGKQRFIRGAKAAAVLSHPNICMIYNIEEYDGQQFIAMEYIEGKRLDELIESGGLKTEVALDIAMQIAEGLQQAHKKGIVHNDLKSSNVMITEQGQVKLIDFGLARFLDSPPLTMEGKIMGTVQYMSPEQSRGKKVDHRSDIWSLGVVLNEMLTGKRPFQRANEQTTIYANLNDHPHQIDKLTKGVPVELQEIVHKCLAKKPSGRYQQTGELTDDLWHLNQKYYSEKSIEVNLVLSRNSHLLRPSFTRLKLPKRMFSFHCFYKRTTKKLIQDR